MTLQPYMPEALSYMVIYMEVQVWVASVLLMLTCIVAIYMVMYLEAVTRLTAA